MVLKILELRVSLVTVFFFRSFDEESCSNALIFNVLNPVSKLTLQK